MNKIIFPALVATLLGLHAGTAAALDETTSGDVVTAILPLASFGIAYFKDDGEGEKQFLRSTTASLIVNSILRLGFEQTSWGTRPNGHPYGFPSGHAGFVTSSAAFLQDRYGWEYGLPAYLAVGYVSYVRVDTGHHRWRDVIAGSAVSYGISKLFVTPQNATHIAPVIGPDIIGLRWERSF